MATHDPVPERHQKHSPTANVINKQFHSLVTPLGGFKGSQVHSSKPHSLNPLFLSSLSSCPEATQSPSATKKKKRKEKKKRSSSTSSSTQQLLSHGEESLLLQEGKAGRRKWTRNYRTLLGMGVGKGVRTHLCAQPLPDHFYPITRRVTCYV